MRHLTVVLALFASQALAQADAKCEVAKPMEGQRLMRRLSLDLRGFVPSYLEQQDQRGKADVQASTIDGYLASADFVKTMRRYHEELLWPNLEAADVDPLQNRLFTAELAPGVTVYFSILRALEVRTVTAMFPPCANRPLEYNTPGVPSSGIKTYPLMVGGQVVAQQEGWVEVQDPYWAPGTRVKVCGFDAQATATGRMCTPTAVARSPYMAQFCQQFGAYAQALQVPFTNAPAACDTNFAFLSDECGCGPNLRLCQALVPSDDPVGHPERAFNTGDILRKALIDQQMRIVEDVVQQDLPYTEILLRKRVAMNGPIAHYLSYQSRGSFDVFGEVDPTSPVPPSLTWLDKNTWVDVDRTGRHSGLLTTPGYLLKYQSNRGRAHRFYNAFECSSFIPAGALPSPQEACSKHEDLTQRCGCDACHVRLEPMAAHWGRFAEYGLTPLGEARYPKMNTTVCAYPYTSMEQVFRCFRFYVTDPVGEEAAYRNMLRPYVFRTDADVQKLETGPAALAQDSIDSGRFASCTVRKMWNHYMRRSPTPDEEATVIPQLADEFKGGGYHLKGLVRSIVSQPAYRRLP